MKYYRPVTYFIALLLMALSFKAESKTNVLVNLADSAEVYKALYANTPIEPEFKLAPKFAIVGADEKFVFSTGASMKFLMSFDWNNPVKNPTGMVSRI